MTCSADATRNLYVMVLSWICLVTAFASAQAVGTPNPGAESLLKVRICQIAWGGSTIGTGAAAVAITEFPRYAALYPNISWEYSLLSKNGNVEVSDLAQGVLDAAPLCTAYLGPSTSQQAVPIAPLIDKVWVSDTVSSTELSNKDTYPTFSRVISTVASLGHALARYILERGWTRASIVASDETYGITVAYDFSDVFLHSGGALDLTFAVSATDGGESLRAALRRIKAEAKSRVILVAYLQGTNVADIIVSEGMHRNFIFLFDESLCALESIKLSLSGAICTIGTPNATALAALKASVLAQPPGYFKNLSAAPLSLMPFTGEENLSELSGFTSDALGFLMKGFHLVLESVSWNVTAFQALPVTTLIARIRNNTELDSGITGDVRMDALGDRPDDHRTIFQIQPRAQLVPLALWDDVNGLQLSLPLDHWLYWMNQSSPSSAPSWSRHESRDFVVDPLVLIGSATAACFVIIVLGAVIRLQCSSDEAKFRALRSGASWALIGGLTVRLAHNVTDIVSFISVVLRDPAEPDIFIGFYGSLIILGILVSLLEIQYMIRYFHITLLDDELTELETVHWRLRLKRSHLMNVFADDLPMLVISAVALLSSFNWLVLINMIFSGVLVGMSLDLVLEIARVAVEQNQQWISVGGVGREGESPASVQPATTPNSSTTSPKQIRLSSVPLPLNPFSAPPDSQGKVSKVDVAGGLRRVEIIFALDYKAKWNRPSLSVSGPNGDDEAEDVEPDAMQVDRLVNALELLPADEVRFAVAKADEDAVWISSMHFTTEVLYAVFLHRLKSRLNAQDDELFEKSVFIKEDSKELGLLFGPNLESLDEGSALAAPPPPLPTLDLGENDLFDSSGEHTPSTETTPRRPPSLM